MATARRRPHAWTLVLQVSALVVILLVLVVTIPWVGAALAHSLQGFGVALFVCLAYVAGRTVLTASRHPYWLAIPVALAAATMVAGLWVPKSDDADGVDAAAMFGRAFGLLWPCLMLGVAEGDRATSRRPRSPDDEAAVEDEEGL